MPAEPRRIRRVLSLDGGGTKGFYTLGILKELEAQLGSPLHKHFDLIYGTSSGSFTGAMLALGASVEAIIDFYRYHVADVLNTHGPGRKSAALRKACEWCFGKRRASDFLTGIGIVCTDWNQDRPIVFKSDPRSSSSRTGDSDWGCTIAEAVLGSCSAYPFFRRVKIDGPPVVYLIDGGYCATNPTLLAIEDALGRFDAKPSDLRVLSLGVGVYPAYGHGGLRRLIKRLEGVRIISKMLAIQTEAAEQMRQFAFPEIHAVRINDHFFRTELAIDVDEGEEKILNLLLGCGRQSYANNRDGIGRLLAPVANQAAVSADRCSLSR